MPGSLITLECPSCAASFEISTGVGWASGREWRYEQRVCTTCQSLQSQPAPDLFNQGNRCADCGGEPVPWAGRVWHEADAEGHMRERVEGPCPRCGAALQRDPLRIGLWD
jgi:hypothetical protein